MPAIPLHTAVSYVAGAYLVFFALVLIYISIMATKLSRIEVELSELTELAIAERERRSANPPVPSELPGAEAPTAGAPKSRAAAR